MTMLLADVWRRHDDADDFSHTVEVNEDWWIKKLPQNKIAQMYV